MEPVETLSRAAFSGLSIVVFAIFVALSGTQGAKASLVPIVQEGDAAVDADLGINSTFLNINPSSIAISNSGTVSFVATINQTVDGVTTPSGVWRQVGSEVILVGDATDGKALEGQNAFGASSSTTHGIFGGTDINLFNQISFTATLDDGTTAIYVSTPAGDGLTLVAQEGDAAPGLTNTFLGVLGPVSLNNTGDVAFRTLLTGPGVTTAPEVQSDEDSLWKTLGGTLELVSREDDPFPPAGMNAEIAGFEYPVDMNDDGDVAAIVQCRQGSCGVDQDSGVLFMNGAAELIVREADDVPEQVSNIDFANFDSDNSPVISSDGTVAFTAPFDNGSSGIFVDDGMGGLDLILEEGDMIGDFFVGDLDGISLGYNDNGEIVFLIETTGGDQVLIEWDGSMFNELARTGDVVPGTSGATITSLFLPHGTGFNNAGQVVVWAELSDGTNNILVDAENVPEPGTLGLIGGGLFGLFAAHRYRRRKAT